MTSRPRVTAQPSVRPLRVRHRHARGYTFAMPPLTLALLKEDGGIITKLEWMLKKRGLI